MRNVERTQRRTRAVLTNIPAAGAATAASSTRSSSNSRNRRWGQLAG